MKFLPTSIPDVWLIDLGLQTDERGFFARTYCEREFETRGLNTRWPQTNLSHTIQRGTIRGLHFQTGPKPEIKLIRCSVGAIFDVLLDIRKTSPTFGCWQAFELSANNRHMLYVPAGVAHGFQCLIGGSEVIYNMSEYYYPELARGVRWNDPKSNIPWPVPNPTLSERDRELPVLDR